MAPIVPTWSTPSTSGVYPVGPVASGESATAAEPSVDAQEQQQSPQDSIQKSTVASLVVLKLNELIRDRFNELDLATVRVAIAQHGLILLLICVIITYLIYYFTRLSRRPKLIGCDRSKFVKFVDQSLAQVLEKRFNPLIYFWGTNPQTALFGYLQGQTSGPEMPIGNFYRQFLYVSDAQYLTSNVDLTEHYRNKQATSTNQVTANATELDASKCSDERNKKKKKKKKKKLQTNSCSTTSVQVESWRKPLELRVDLEVLELPKTEVGLQLSENLRAVLDKPGWLIGDQVEACRVTRMDSSELPSGASSDSGVSLAGCRSSSNSSSSSSSLSDVTGSNSPCSCNCKLAYQHNGQLKTTPLPVASVTCDDAGGIELRREQLEFGQCALDWYKPSHELYHKNRLVALISAGMTTGSDKKYVADTVRTLADLGYEVCVFIRRGVGGLKLSSDKFFSPAKWRDFEAAVLSVRCQRPKAQLVAVGFSFGSIELCRYLCMSSAQSQVHAALLISCPFDPEAGGWNMRKRVLNRRIDAYLARNLGKQLYWALVDQQQVAPGRVHENYNGSRVDLAELPKVRSLVDFENNYNRPLQNYPSSEAYAADSRLQDHLWRIRTPTLCLSSEDDFMAPLALLPLDQIRANPCLAMVLTKCGGHMAFIDGLLWPTKPYFAQRIIGAYMRSVRGDLERARRRSSGSLLSLRIFAGSADAKLLV